MNKKKDKDVVVVSKTAVKECVGCTGFKGNSSGAAYQDEKYGVGRRVHTFSAKGNARCTVCGKERS